MSLLDQQPDSVAIAVRTTPPALMTVILANQTVLHIAMAVISFLLTVAFLLMQMHYARKKDRRAEERNAEARQLREDRAAKRALDYEEDDDE